MIKWTIGILLIIVIQACSSTPAPQHVLDAPTHISPIAKIALMEGNKQYQQGQWGQAKQEYEKAIGVDPTCAEAHYNLAMALEKTGQRQAAKKHYLEAANLAPGHKIIWDSPPLRKYGDVKSSSPAASSSDPVFSPLGGGGAGAGSGLGY